jgi:hypothetical protein
VTLSHELKIKRAFGHLKEIERISRVWLGGNHHSVRRDVELDGSIVFLATAEDPPEDPLSLLIGEFLHNMRSALDNLAFALACSFTAPLPNDVAKASEFPIFGDKDGQGHAIFSETTSKGDPTRRSGLHKIQGWDPRAQTEVERLQPYHRGPSYEDDPLWILHELDRINKHRLHHGVVGHTDGFMWDPMGSVNLREIVPADGGSIALHSLGVTVETDTPIARFCNARIVPIDPSKEVNVKIVPALAITFSKATPIVEHERVTKVFRSIYSHVRGVVLPALTPYM